ncbi:serpentine type 7TM GPCR receptor class ab chemoreceptor domain-containing protein [Ditylenchus destructor]|uniref:Serpentine type 7TM GPCR receptor class ab chemoreceptor domain-containing protein n=1 Tax=Ditylenchus destructor TaxID=166010 RepID=A0AAD4MLI7_9BILA|nr:serpentine type 7TM GPCR receptor class ab chemoreceptor domain-containing protein [Ditylenchus destructor]
MTYPYSNRCNRLWTTILLFISRAVHITFKHGITSSLVVLCIERIICICRISNYEQSSKPILVAVLLTVITAVSSLGFTLVYMSDIEWNEGMASTTARNKMDADKYQTQSKIFHPNTKVISLYVCGIEFFLALQGSSFYMYEMWRISYPYDDPCDRLWSTPLLFTLRCIYLASLNGVNLSLVVLFIERVICICRISNYEQSSRPILVAVVLLTITAIFSVVTVILYIPGVNFDEGLAVTTARNSKNGFNYQLMICYLLALELLAACCFLFLHNWSLWYRKRIRGFHSLKQRKEMNPIHTDQSLSVKFQIEETIKMTSLFLPIVLVKCSFSIFSYVAASIANMIWTNPSSDFQMITFEATYISTIMPLFVVILVTRGIGQIRQIFCCHNEHRTEEVTILSHTQTQDDYFNRLNQMFDTTAPKVPDSLSRTNLNLFQNNRVLECGAR